MPTTNLSIKLEPVLDFACQGWPQDKRDELFHAAQEIEGVTSVDSAGHSTMRIRYDSSNTDPAALTLAVDQLADTILPGHNFANGTGG